MAEVFRGVHQSWQHAPPEITSGPTATPNQLFSDESAQLSATASDADNDPLAYNWIVPPGGGSIDGSGPTVTYLPAAVTATQTFTISVEVSDGRGGTATGMVDVTVEPAPLGTMVSFRPVADAWVNESSPAQNLGDTNRLTVDGRAVATAFLRFDVTGLNAPVIRLDRAPSCSRERRWGHRARRFRHDLGRVHDHVQQSAGHRWACPGLLRARNRQRHHPARCHAGDRPGRAVQLCDRRQWQRWVVCPLP